MEANPEKMEPGTEHQEVPKEHAAVKPVKGPRSGMGVKCGRRASPEAKGADAKKLLIKEETDSRQQKNDPACKSGTAQRKRHRGKPGPGPTWYEEPGEDTFGRKHQPEPERKNGIRNRGPIEQLRSKRKFKTLRETLGLEIEKQAVGIPSGLREMRNWLLWRGRLPPKRKKNLLAMRSRLRFPDSRLTDGDEVVSLTHRPPFAHQKDSWYSFLLEAESTPGP
jgi:hypothetical protein